MPVDMFDPESLLNPHLRDMEEYVPIQPFEVLSQELGLSPQQLVKLDANENPFGPPPAVLAALAEYPYYHIYPDPEQRALRQAVAQAYRVPFESVAMGSGADELLDCIGRLFLSPVDSILNLPPTFGMYSFSAQLAGAAVQQVWRRSDFSVDMDAVEEAVVRSQAQTDSRVKIVFATSPNNPSGTWFPDEDLQRLLDLPVLVILDEAYVDFALQKSRMDWVARFPNLIVLRTFSKAMGLAGLRLGFGIFPEWFMPYFWKCKQPYNVNVAAYVAGLASLQQMHAVQDIVRKIREARVSLLDDLAHIRYLEGYPSEANFVLCRVLGREARAMWRELRDQGILLRYYNRLGLADCIRISIGRPEQMARLMEALHSMQKE